MDDEFFKKYNSTFREAPGIPGQQMNAPLATNTHLGQIGLELELEPARGGALPRDGHLEVFKTPKTKARWLSIEDGSLRNGGREFIVSAPILVEELDGALDALWEAFDLSKVELANSNRCSTHVHINISGKTINFLTSIIVLWGTFEELLINWCGEERKTNHFCLSSKDSLSLVQAWDRLLSSGATAPFADRNLRYGALNVNPIWGQGSVEFRCGPAADTKELPKLWARFLHDFCLYATTNYPNPEQIGFDLSERGGYRMFVDIAGKYNKTFCDQVLDGLSVQQVDEMALAGFRNVQRLALGYPWTDWLPLINREFVPNPFAKKPGPKRGLRIDPGLRAQPEMAEMPAPRREEERDWVEHATRPQWFNEVVPTAPMTAAELLHQIQDTRRRLNGGL